MEQGRHAMCEGVALTAQDMPGPSFNFAAALGDVPPLDRILALADEFFGEREGGYGILVEADAGHPVEAELRVRGWIVVQDEPALVLPTIPAPPHLPGLEIRVVTNAAGREDYIHVLAAAFETPPGDVARLLPPLPYGLGPDAAMLVGYLGDQPVSSAGMYLVADVAGIGGVATLPDCRGRGFGGALTLAAAAEGAARGCTVAALRSGPLSFPLYVRLGFIHVCNHRTYAPAP
jgi:GNAT superfamily N-acetyltransferase